ncbi:MAG: helix-turn-helix domain-containing protein [Nitrososphaeria archaeon]|nr:helix-turn-helix domain-containing protein [Nitrososphaeria archaeon]
MNESLTFFNSKSKFKILKILLEEDEINISALIRKTRISYKFVERYLFELENEGIIRQKRFGKIRIISLEDNKLTRVLKDFFITLEKVEKEDYRKGYI